MNHVSSDAGLAELKQRVQADLAKISYATGNWCIPASHNDDAVLDVAIIGAGQGAWQRLLVFAGAGFLMYVFLRKLTEVARGRGSPLRGCSPFVPPSTLRGQI